MGHEGDKLNLLPMCGPPWVTRSYKGDQQTKISAQIELIQLCTHTAVSGARASSYLKPTRGWCWKLLHTHLYSM